MNEINPVERSGKRSVIRAAIRAFAGDRKGAVAVIFALVLVPTLLLAGLSIDLSGLLETDTKARQAADAAALAYAGDINEQIASGIAQPDKARAKGLARSVFALNFDGVDGSRLISLQIEESSDGKSVFARYTIRQPLTFASLAGLDSWDKSGSTQVGLENAASLPPIVSFLLDYSKSMSMGLNFDESEKIRKAANTFADSYDNWDCAFVCHGHSELQTAWFTLDNPWQRALRNGVIMRYQAALDGIDYFGKLLDRRVNVTFGQGGSMFYQPAGLNYEYKLPMKIWTANSLKELKKEFSSEAPPYGRLAPSKVIAYSVYPQFVGTYFSATLDKLLFYIRHYEEKLWPSLNYTKTVTFKNGLIVIVTDGHSTVNTSPGEEVGLGVIGSDKVYLTKFNAAAECAKLKKEYNASIAIIKFKHYKVTYPSGPNPISGISFNKSYTDFPDVEPDHVNNDLKACASPGLFWETGYTMDSVKDVFRELADVVNTRFAARSAGSNEVRPPKILN